MFKIHCHEGGFATYNSEFLKNYKGIYECPKKVEKQVLRPISFLWRSAFLNPLHISLLKFVRIALGIGLFDYTCCMSMQTYAQSLYNVYLITYVEPRVVPSASHSTCCSYVHRCLKILL